MTSPSSRQGGLSPEFAGTLAYVCGPISGLIILAIEKEDKFVRFHAMQAIFFVLAVLVADLLLKGLPLVGPYVRVPFLMGVAALWIFLMYQAFNGKRFKLPYIGDFAEHQLK